MHRGLIAHRLGFYDRGGYGFVRGFFEADVVLGLRLLYAGGVSMAVMFYLGCAASQKKSGLYYGKTKIMTYKEYNSTS
jgi:hypothetical protein